MGTQCTGHHIRDMQYYAQLDKTLHNPLKPALISVSDCEWIATGPQEQSP